MRTEPTSPPEPGGALGRPGDRTTTLLAGLLLLLVVALYLWARWVR